MYLKVIFIIKWAIGSPATSLDSCCSFIYHQLSSVAVVIVLHGSSSFIISITIPIEAFLLGEW